jgi:hypothetical protein
MPSLRQVTRTRIYARRAPVGELVADMTRLRTLDRRHETFQLWWRRLAWLTTPGALVGGLVLGVPLVGRGIDPDAVPFTVLQVAFLVFFIGLSFGVTYIRKQDRPSWQPTRESKTKRWLVPIAGMGLPFALFALDVPASALTPLVFAALPAAFVFMWRYRHHNRLNLEDRRYSVVEWVLEMLRADLDPARPLSLRMDLEPSDVKRKLVGVTEGYVTSRTYEDPWLALRGRLLDGTTFTLEWLDRVKTKTRVKSKGRVKKKRVEKCRVSLELKVKREKYPHLGALGDAAAAAVQLPPNASIRSCRASRDGLLLEVQPTEAWLSKHAEATGGVAHREQIPSYLDPVPGERMLAMMFLSLYQVLNLSAAKKKLATT